MFKSILITLSCVSSVLHGAVVFDNVFENTNSEYDVTNSSCKDDLAEMKMYSEEYVTENPSLITFTQIYDSTDDLKTYAYFCLPNQERVYSLNITYKVPKSPILPMFENITELVYANEVNRDDDLPFFKYELLSFNERNLGMLERDYEVASFNTIIGNEHINAYEVGKTFHFVGFTNDTIESGWSGVETITITEKEVVNYRYGNDFNLFGLETGLFGNDNTYTDAWYVFFNTDKRIDILVSATISFVPFDFCVGRYGDNSNLEHAFTYDYVNEFVNSPPSSYKNFVTSGDIYIKKCEQEVVEISSGTSQIKSVSPFLWTYGDDFLKYYESYETLDNIIDLKAYKKQDSDKFVFTEQADTYNWGVLFDTSLIKSYQEGSNGVSGFIEGKGLTDITILRLKFKTGGILYNLGAVDVPTDDYNPEHISAGGYPWSRLLSTLLGVLGIVVLILVIYLLFKTIPFFMLVHNTRQNKKLIKIIEKKEKKERRR